MSQAYNDNKKGPKLEENQLGFLEISSTKFSHFSGN